MSPIDFQGVGLLDPSLVVKLDRYLQDKESQTAHAILHAIRGSIPAIPEIAVAPLKLSDTAETISKNILKISHPSDWKAVVSSTNKALWNYVEILEGAVNELDQQIGQIGIEQWSPELIQGVGNIKELVDHRLEELGWIIQRLDGLLWDLKKAIDGKRVRWFWISILDPSLIKTVKKTRAFLINSYQNFCERYSEYRKLRAKAEHSIEKFDGYFVFSTLEEGERSEIKKLYGLIKTWELNKKLKAVPAREAVRALRAGFSPEQVIILLKSYLEALKESLFEGSRKLKKAPSELYGATSGRNIAAEVVKGYRAEVHTLAALTNGYREFYLRTHPNPYIRNRWGFSEWIVGPEPAPAKGLLDLIFELEKLDRQYERLEEAVEVGPKENDQEQLAELKNEIDSQLHEMGQPLLSKNSIRSRALKLLNLLEEINELGSFVPESVPEMGEALSKAMKADWQFQTLFDEALFHELYHLHQGIAEHSEDRRHLSRLNAFEENLKQIKGWVENRTSHRHVKEIETDMNDIRMTLQDFLAQAKRGEGSQEEFSRQLLEYRYLFGNFFNTLNHYEREGKMIRNQFLFGDQYFESIPK